MNPAVFEGFGVGFLAPLLDLYTVSERDNASSISNDFAQFENSETDGHALFFDFDAGSWGALGDVQLKSITSFRELDYEDSVDIDGESIALYGQAEWSPPSMERLSVTLGLRYTEEDKDQYIVHPNASGTGFTFDVEDSDSWDNTSGSLIVAYDLADDVNIYGKVSQGWKSGGFNGEAPTADAFREGYDAEEVVSFEAGIKSRFAGGNVQLNAAAFYNEVTDLQVSVFLEGAGAAASNVANAGEATFQGLELELIWQLVESVVVSANYGYLDAEYDEFIENGVDVKDAKDVPYASENTLSLTLDWALGNVGFGDLDLHVD